MTRHKNKSIFKARSFYLWHRYVGITSALFVIILSITGLLLNHTDQFNLKQRFISSDLVLNLYNISAPEPIGSYTNCALPINLVGEYLYYGNHKIEGSYEHLNGAVATDGICAILLGHKLLLLEQSGEKIDIININQEITFFDFKIGLNPDNKVIIALNNQFNSIDDEWLNIIPLSKHSNNINWSLSSPLNTQQKNNLKADYQSHILTLETLLLDLHSGRILGDVGVFIMDLAAILLLFLSFSGFFLWWRQLSKKRQHSATR